MKIRKALQVWFDCPNDTDHGKILVRYLKDGDKQELYQEAAKIHVTYIDGKPQTTISTDQIKDRELTVCRSVVDWQNFFDDQGKPMPCTDENKKRFSREDGFMAFLAECRRKLEEQVEAEKRAEEKNLQTSQSGFQVSTAPTAKNADQPS